MEEVPMDRYRVSFCPVMGSSSAGSAGEAGSLVSAGWLGSAGAAGSLLLLVQAARQKIMAMARSRLTILFMLSSLHYAQNTIHFVLFYDIRVKFQAQSRFVDWP